MPEESKRSLAAVWFADVVGYTALSERDEDAALRLVAELQTVAREEVEARSGRLVKFIGDAVLAVFESSGDAVAAGLAVRHRFQQSRGLGGEGALLRVGVHVGEIVNAPDGDVYGDGVNTAARIQAVAEPGEVLVSGFTVEGIRQRREFWTVYRGERLMKGLSRPMQLFAVGREGVDPPPEPTAGFPAEGVSAASSPRGALPWKSRRVWGTTVVLAAGLAVVGWWARHGSPGDGAGATGGVPTEDPVLAVLPFEDFSPAGDQAYLADGLHEELLHQLAALPGIRLSSRTSTSHFRGSPATTSVIADSLGARYVLEGSVTRWGDSIQVTAQLIHAASDAHLWSVSETRVLEMDALFGLQRALAGGIARSLGGTLAAGTGRPAGAAPTSDLEAYHAYLRGLHLSSQFSMESMEAAAVQFQRAIALDPEFGLAHAKLALTYTILNNFGERVQGELFPRIREHASLAMTYAPNHAASSMAMSMIHWPQEWDWEAARQDFERALELDPNYVDARWALAEWYGVLAGNTDRGLQLIRETERLDPLAIQPPTVRAWILMVGRRYQAAVEQYRTLSRLAPEDPNHVINMASLLPFIGEVEEARRLLEGLLESMPYPRPVTLAVPLARAGMEEEAGTVLAEALALKESGGGVPASGVAAAYAALGDTEAALTWLERSFDREGGVYYLRSPDWDPIRDEPRFQVIWERLGLPGGEG